MKKFKTSLIEEILKSHTTLLEAFFGNPKIKHTVMESKKEKLFIEDEEEQTDGNNTLKSYTMIQKSLKKWKERRRLRPKNWVQQ